MANNDILMVSDRGTERTTHSAFVFLFLCVSVTLLVMCSGICECLLKCPFIMCELWVDFCFVVCVCIFDFF